MFYNLTIQYYEDLFNELIQAPDNEIQEALSLIKKTVPDNDFKPLLKGFVKGALEFTSSENLDEEEFDEFFISNLKSFASHVVDLNKSLIIEARLKGFEEQIYRVMEIPYVMTIADLAYAVLGSMECMAEHLFSIKYKKQTYFCHYYENDFDDDVLYAENENLCNLGLRKGSKFLLNYDFGDNYEIEIKVKQINKNKTRFDFDDMNMLDGSGYGIWEDAHYEMNLFYYEPEMFKAYLDENGLDEEMYPVEEEFDLDAANIELLDNFILMKGTYEYVEDDDFDIEDFDDLEDFDDDLDELEDLPF